METATARPTLHPGRGASTQSAAISGLGGDLIADERLLHQLQQRRPLLGGLDRLGSRRGEVFGGLPALGLPARGNFVLEMQKAASDTRKTVIVLSDHYLKADYTQPEWAAAFVNDPRGEHRNLIPFRVEKCSPTGLLKPLIYADLIGLTPEKAKETVLTAVSDARPKPPHEPGFPGKVTTPGHPAPVTFPGTPAPAPQAGTAHQRTNRARAIWQEKRDFLKEQEAIVADPAQKFALRKQIEEAEEKIRELT